MTSETVYSYIVRWTTPNKYLKAKLKILTRDFCIYLTETELKHLKSLKTQVEIDNAILTIIDNRWE